MNEGRKNRRITLPDGRRLGYAEYGIHIGTPVFYFHGFPGSRLDWELITDDGALLDLNIRIIAPDRPGYGLSDPKKGRTLMDWPDDVSHLADELKIDRFAVMGLSGGGPYAAACASRIADRLTKTGIVSGMGPPDAPGMKKGVSWTLPGMPALVRWIVLRLMAKGVLNDPDQFLQKTKDSLGDVDKLLLDRQELSDAFLAGMKEAFRRGIHGAKSDSAILARPWGFALEKVSTETYLWHGEKDLNVPVSVARHLAEKIPSCRAVVHESHGHLTLPHTYFKEILTDLISPQEA